jgi:hypothetical protein
VHVQFSLKRIFAAIHFESVFLDEWLSYGKDGRDTEDEKDKNKSGKNELVDKDKYWEIGSFISFKKGNNVFKVINDKEVDTKPDRVPQRIKPHKPSRDLEIIQKYAEMKGHHVLEVQASELKSDHEVEQLELITASLKKNDLMPDNYFDDKVSRHIGKMDVNWIAKGPKYEMINGYVTACKLPPDAEPNVVRDSINIAITDDHVIILKEKWMNWRLYKDCQIEIDDEIEMLQQDVDVLHRDDDDDILPHEKRQ